VEILDGLVVPAADALIGRELAVVVQTADVLGSAAVQAGNGSAAVGTVVAGGGESQIDAGQELLERSLSAVLALGSIGVTLRSPTQEFIVRKATRTPRI